MNLRTKARFAKLWASTESAEVSESVSTTEVGGNENGAVVVEEIRVEKELALDLAAMEQDIAILDQDESTAEELATATEEIVRLGDAVESFASEGGLNRQGAQFLNMALESITARVGLEFNVPAVESFSGSFGDRVAMTASLEAGIGESLKKMWDALVQFVKEQFGKLKDFVKRLFDSREKLKVAIKTKSEAFSDAKANVTVSLPEGQDITAVNKAVAGAGDLVKGLHEGALAFTEILKPSTVVELGDKLSEKESEMWTRPLKANLVVKGDGEYDITDLLFGSINLVVGKYNVDEDGLPVFERRTRFQFNSYSNYESKEADAGAVTQVFNGMMGYCDTIKIDALLKSLKGAVDKVIADHFGLEEDNNSRIASFMSKQITRIVGNMCFVRADVLNIKAMNKFVASAKLAKAEA